MAEPVKTTISLPGEPTSIVAYKTSGYVVLETSRGNAVYMYRKEAAAFCEWFKREFPDG